ncbi:MAG: dephospho-CoA kinase [Wenzhouxiangella sp.]|nr:MAG: dephospho-CoA kinase [Wenzhouxiangella sp.]
MSAPAAANSDRQRPLLVALTGGIASGKTAVSDRLAALGAQVIDTDLIARKVVEPGQPGLAAILEAFGKEVIRDDGRLDRAELRARIFEDAASRQRLENLLHPLIKARVEQDIATSTDSPYIVLVVPLLVETGLFTDADRIVVVDVPEATQLERLTRRDGGDERQARAILAAQASRRQRLDKATDVIDNSGSLAELQAQVDSLHERLTGLAE